MNYKEIKKVLDAKNLNIYEVAKEMGITYEGLKLSIERETIQLKNIKKFCQITNIEIVAFCDNINFDNIHYDKKQNSNFDALLTSKDKEITYLKELISGKNEIISDKNEIIRLLKKEKQDNNPYGNIAAEPK